MAFKMTGRQRVIKVHAEHFHNPITNFKAFNSFLYSTEGIRTRKEEVEKLLGYT